MDEKTAIEALCALDELIERAIKIVDGAPYHEYVSEPDFARLYVNDDGTAELHWPNATSDYDSYTIETERVEFPASLLYVSDDELNAWKAEQKAAYERKRKIEIANEARAREEHERRQYEALKAKFGE